MYALATGGFWGVGPGQQRDEVGPAAARGVRLHLRDHRRGARLPRLPGRRHPVRRARLRRLPHRPALDRPVHPAGQRRDHRLAGRPGGDEHGLRRRAAAGHRRPAAADLRRRHVAGAHPVHRRAAGPLRPLRARGDREPSAPRPRAGWPGCCCRCPRAAVEPVRRRHRPVRTPAARLAAPAATAGRSHGPVRRRRAPAGAAPADAR